MKTQTPLIIPADHPAFAGHFPGMPIVPGVVLLDAALQAIASACAQPVTAWQVSSVKFLSPLLPGQAATISHEVQASGSVRFEVLSEQRQIVSGSLAPAAGTAFEQHP